MVEAKSEDIVNLHHLKKIKLKFKPSNITYSNLFGNPDMEEYNIAYSFLESLSKMDIKMFDAIVSNVILAGGLWRVKNMQMYFKRKIKEQLPKFRRLLKLKIE